MNQFVFIFRQCEITHSPAVQQQRVQEVRAWALAQLAAGTKLDPRLLGETYHRIAPDGGNPAVAPHGEATVVALGFLEFATFDEAVKVAGTHPGLRYGVSIEVREWSLPPAMAASKPLGQSIVP